METTEKKTTEDMQLLQKRQNEVIEYEQHQKLNLNAFLGSDYVKQHQAIIQAQQLQQQQQQQVLG